MTRAVLVAGAGGVGKTTIAAAIGVAAARAGKSTLVLTVDPARRLAGALGLDHIGNDPTPTPGEPLLAAAMLDASASWEAIVRRHADPDTVERLVTSRFFRAVADRFPAGQAYAGAEEMSVHLESGAFDLVVVDTPPSAGGIDFFLSPGRMRTLVGGRILRWLTGPKIPGRRALYAITARPVLKVADTLLGGPLLEDVAEFLLDLRTAYDGISRRARQVERHLRGAVSIVVTTADPTPVREAVRFFRELPAAAPTPAAIVFNRALPLDWRHAGAPEGPPDLAEALAGTLDRWGSEAQRQADVRSEFVERYDVLPTVIPWLTVAPTDRDSLAGLLAASEGTDLTVLATS
ncbi:MAG TPA: ArsA-related P-loop ATPase [Acidimicrobiia bacterium]|nr:ArsA-related P-loop ATPase [Acidimicrobiia bacterium]